LHLHHLFLLAILLALGPRPALAEGLLGETHLLGIAAGSDFSSVARALARGGYELSDGRFVSFRDWYGTDRPELRIDLLTRLGEGAGLIWGVNTGERGEKYRIHPGVKLGVILQQAPTPRSTLTLTVTTVIGGGLREENCVADYGEIGGIQAVNCRLAAAPIAPEATLQHTLRVRAREASRIDLSYRMLF
jgi:hypothetical protein